VIRLLDPASPNPLAAKSESLFPVDHGIPQKSATIRTAGWAFARLVVVFLIRLHAKGVTSLHLAQSQPVLPGKRTDDFDS